MNDEIEVLEVVLKTVRERDQEIALLKQSFDAAVESVKLRDITIAGLQAALELANEKCVECDRQVQEFQAEAVLIADENVASSSMFYKESRDYSYAEVLVEEGKTLAAWLTDGKGCRVFSLLKLDDDEVIDGNLEEGQDFHTNMRDFAEYCVRNDAVFLLPVITKLQGVEINQWEKTADLLCGILAKNKNTFRREISSAWDLIQERDRKIGILEDNLDPARSEHLEQLRAFEQMVKSIRSGGFDHGGDCTYGALKLVLAVVQNNIAKLDPNLCDRQYLGDRSMDSKYKRSPLLKHLLSRLEAPRFDLALNAVELGRINIYSLEICVAIAVVYSYGFRFRNDFC